MTMVRHLIVFNKREDASDEACRLMGELAREVLAQIPGVTHVSFGRSVLEEARYRYYLFVDFIDRSVIPVYLDHPIHIRFAENHFRPMAPDRITTDYDIVF